MHLFADPSVTAFLSALIAGLGVGAGWAVSTALVGRVLGR